uniref:Transthyretin-like family protein n=1 Tax=Syphacia muris TaxID=451379 RepID=A0A0N5APV3_9BILA
MSNIKWICLLLLVLTITFVECNTECVWASGKLVCKKRPEGVLNATVTLFDKDGPSKVQLINPDDKMGFTTVNTLDGIFNVEGCASDYDWFFGIKNRPEASCLFVWFRFFQIYIRVHHYCNSPKGEFLKVLPTFRVFVPESYDYHMRHPIELD